MKCQHKKRSVLKKRLPAIASSAVWEKVTKGRAEIGWDNVFDKVWEGIAGNQEDILSMEERHVLEDMKKINECDMDKFGTLDNSE